MPEASTALADLVEPAWPASAPRGLLDDDHRPGASSAFRVALLIPMCGSAGIWGPSCIASAQVAAHELNRRNGIAGRDVQLVLIDSAIEAQTPVEVVVQSLIESGSIDAIVGMHISAVRQRLTKVVAGRIPYVYTPLYEGGEHGFGVLSTAENACFRESYHGFHGDRAPVLNALGQSTYEGLQFLASLMRDGRGDWRERAASAAEPIAYRSARQAIHISNSNHRTPIYLARADGMVFRIVTQIY